MQADAFGAVSEGNDGNNVTAVAMAVVTPPVVIPPVVTPPPGDARTVDVRISARTDDAFDSERARSARPTSTFWSGEMRFSVFASPVWRFHMDP